MSVLLRTLLTWLLALAVPTQGFAASTMLFCGPAHHGSKAVLNATADEHAGHARSAAALMSVARSDHHRSSTQADKPATQDQTAIGGMLTSSKPRNSTGGKGSTCAACCTSAAISATALLVEVEPVSNDYAASPAEPPARLTTGGLERPPKHVLA